MTKLFMFTHVMTYTVKSAGYKIYEAKYPFCIKTDKEAITKAKNMIYELNETINSTKSYYTLIKVERINYSESGQDELVEIWNKENN